MSECITLESGCTVEIIETDNCQIEVIEISGGGGGLSGITQDTTLYIETAGDDASGTGKIDAPFKTLNRCLEYLDDKAIIGDAFVTIQLGDGDFYVTEALVANMQNPEKIGIYGNNDPNLPTVLGVHYVQRDGVYDPNTSNKLRATSKQNGFLEDYSTNLATIERLFNTRIRVVTADFNGDYLISLDGGTFPIIENVAFINDSPTKDDYISFSYTDNGASLKFGKVAFFGFNYIFESYNSSIFGSTVLCANNYYNPVDLVGSNAYITRLYIASVDYHGIRMAGSSSYNGTNLDIASCYGYGTYTKQSEINITGTYRISGLTSATYLYHSDFKSVTANVYDCTTGFMMYSAISKADNFYSDKLTDIIWADNASDFYCAFDYLEDGASENNIRAYRGAVVRVRYNRSWINYLPEINELQSDGTLIKDVNNPIIFNEALFKQRADIVVDLGTGNSAVLNTQYGVSFEKTITEDTNISFNANNDMSVITLTLINGGAFNTTFSGVTWLTGNTPTLKSSGVDVLRFFSRSGAIYGVCESYQKELDLKQDLSDKSQPNGYASLDGSGKIPTSEIPDSVLSQVEYKGTWDASTNTPTIPTADSTNKGDYYVVSVDGATSVDGINDWLIGDWIISNGTVWEKVDNTESVVSVAGKTGVVVLDHATDLANVGTNTHADIDSFIASIPPETITDLTDGGETTLHYHDSDRDRANHTGTQVFSTVTPDNLIGAPTNITDLNKLMSSHWSSGYVSGGVITDNGDGTVSITTGECMIRSTDSELANLISSLFSAKNNITLTDNATNYIYIDYNLGSPDLFVTTDPTTINVRTKIPLYIVSREGTALTILKVGGDSLDANAKHRQKLFYTETFKRSNGGAIISSPSSLYVACTSGSFWFGLQQLTLPSFDSSGADTFKYYYTTDSGSTWTSSSVSLIDSSQYNDITSGLVSIASNKYVNHWVYAVLSNEGDTHYSVVYGQEQHNSLSLALDEAPPSTVPSSLTVLGILLGVVTVVEGGAIPESVRTSFTTTFSSSQVTSHTQLSDIGTNTHAQIDTHIADATLHFTEGSIDHTAIANIGTNTHAQIDTHIASTSDPHNVSAYIEANGLSDLNLDAINNAINSNTIVDVFIYDTTLDDDGGAWVDEANWQSWYHETLNTATRGATKKFPKIALIVAETNKITIYDATDSSCPMWIVFNAGGGSGWWGSTSTIISITAKNGLVYISGSSNGIKYFDLINDSYHGIIHSLGLATMDSIIYRHSISPIWDGGNTNIVNGNTNDIAVTSDGLMNNTVAVATNGGVSVIHPDGSVADLIYTISTNNISNFVAFKDNGIMWGSREGTTDTSVYIQILNNIPINDYAVAPDGFYSDFTQTVFSPDLYYGASALSRVNALSKNATGGQFGLTQYKHNNSAYAQGMVCYQTADYCSGWMQGDIKGAWLADTTEETIGVDEGTELITVTADRDFSSDTGNWVDFLNGSTGGTVSITGGVLSITQGSNSAWIGAYHQFDSLIVGNMYQLTFDAVSGGNQRVTATDDLGLIFQQYYDVNNSIAGTYTFEFEATATTMYVMLLNGDAASGSGSYDNVSLKGTGNLVINGTFDVDTSGWTLGTGWAYGTNNAVHTQASGSGEIYQLVSNLVVGKNYVFSASIDSSTDSSIANSSFGVQASGGGTYLASVPVIASSNKTYSFTFKATGTYHRVRFFSDDDISIDNISVRLADDDRSVNNDGLEIHGQITKSPVATGAELVAYSGFSANDYLQQPYNPDLNFGTGDFYVMGWVKITDSAGTHDVINTGYGVPVVNESSIRLVVNTSEQMVFQVTETRWGSNDSITSSSFGTTWGFIVAIKHDDKIYLYINGQYDVSAPLVNATTLNLNPEYVLVGKRWDSIQWVKGSLALWRIGAGAPTAEQIKEIYEAEKPLFQENAKCTLQSSSSDVKALSFDDSTNVLTVCSADHLTKFNGLKVVDDEATVATSVSTVSGKILTGV